MSVCVSVCLSVYPLSTFMGLKVGRHIIYGKKQNLSLSATIDIKNPSDQPSGRYLPQSGRWWKIPFSEKSKTQIGHISRTVRRTYVFFCFNRLSWRFPYGNRIFHPWHRPVADVTVRKTGHKWSIFEVFGLFGLLLIEKWTHRHIIYQSNQN